MSFAPTSADAAPSPEALETERFLKALYANTPAGEYVAVRYVPEPKDDRSPKNWQYELGPNFIGDMRSFVDSCSAMHEAAFFLPGTVTQGGTGKADVLSLPAILVDFDKGNPDENLKAAETLIGPATIVVESGGAVLAHPKLHAYWVLGEPARGADIDVACRVREELATRFGGDPAFKQPAQVIRIPGSIHFKSEPKLVRLRSVSDARVSLQAVAKALNVGSSQQDNIVSFFDFSRDKPHVDLAEHALTSPIREGGVDGVTRFEGATAAIGHYIRLMRDPKTAWTEQQAREAAHDWNLTNLNPPWPRERIDRDFSALARIDVDNHGPITPPLATALSAPTKAKLTDWHARCFKGAAPERHWLAEGLVPLGTAGVFAAVGDAGKSMLALRLAHIVGNYPPPQNLTGGPAGMSDAPRFFGQPVTARGAAVILTAEDDKDEVHRRLERLDPGGLRFGDKSQLYVWPLLSTGGARAIMTESPRGPELTAFWHDVRAQLAAVPDLRLVVLDPLSSFLRGDTNDNALGSAFMTELGTVAAETGATVVAIHHFTKGRTPTGLRDAREAVRGAGALVDNGRFALVLWEAEPDEAYGVLKLLGREQQRKQVGIVYFGGLAKGNAPSAKTERIFVRDTETGLLEDMTDTIAANRPRQDETDAAVLAALKAWKVAYPRFDFGISKNTLDKEWREPLRRAGLRISRDQLEAIADRLCEAGEIVVTETKRGGSPIYDLKAG